MAADGQVSLEIQVLGDRASQAVSQFQRETSEALKGVNEKLETMKHLAEVAAVAFVIDHIKDFFKEAIEEASKQEDAVNRMNTALALSGEYSAEASKEMQEFAEHIQATTRFADDAVISQLAIAKAFGISNEQAQNLVQASAELATATGITLDEAVQKLGKTYSGEAGRLGQTIPALKGLTEESLKAGGAIDYVNKRFGGSAAADVNTYSGALAQLQHAMDDVTKARGLIITQDPLVIAGLHALTELFQGNAEAAKKNGDAFRDFVEGGIKAIAVGVPVALDILAFFGRGFEGLVSVVGLAAEGVVQSFDFLIDFIDGIIGGLTDRILGVSEALVRAAGTVPGLGSALKSMGIDAEKAGDGIAALHDSITESLDSEVASVADFHDAVTNGVVATVDKLESFDTALNGFREGVDKVSQAIFDADGKVADSARKTANATKQAAAEDGKARAELAKQAEDYAHAIFVSSLTESQKATQVMHEQLEKVLDFEKAGALGHEEAAKLRTIITQQEADKQVEIQEKAAKEAADLAAKALNDFKQKVGDAAAQPATFAVNLAVKALDIKQLDLTDFQAQLAGAGVGLLGNMLKGAAGAKDLISQGAGAFADAFIPGIGPAVSGVIGQLAQGPEATKKFIREFIAAIPDIVVAIGEAMPAAVEAFVDALVNKGGAIKIGLAIERTMLGEGILKAAGKQLGISVGDNFNASKIGHTLGQGFADESKAIAEWPQKIGEAFEKGIGGLVSGLQQSGDAIRVALAQAPSAIAAGFHEGSSAVTSAVGDAFSAAASKISSTISGVFNAVFGQLKPILSDFLKPLTDLLKSFKLPQLPTFNWPQLPTFNWPKIPTPGWLQSFLDAINSIGGGGGGLKVPKLAVGGTIPSGYANDGLLAHVGTGELVVPQDDVTLLRSFLVKQESGDSGIGNDGVMALLARIASALEGDQTAHVTVEVSGQTLADQMVSLSRRNARLRA